MLRCGNLLFADANHFYLNFHLFHCFSDVSNIKLLTFSSVKDSRKIPDIDSPEKGKSVLSENIVFRWNSETDRNVALVDNGSKLETDAVTYIVSCS